MAVRKDGQSGGPELSVFRHMRCVISVTDVMVTGPVGRVETRERFRRVKRIAEMGWLGATQVAQLARRGSRPALRMPGQGAQYRQSRRFSANAGHRQGAWDALSARRLLAVLLEPVC